LYLQDLLARFGDSYPRRTEVAAFEAVDRRQVAVQNIKVSYDPETGFFGSEVKGSGHQMSLSEYDRVLIVSDDGSFRISGPTGKMLIPGKVLYCDRFDEERGKAFTVVYRDKERNAFGKRVHILKFIRDKEYELIKGRTGKIDMLLPDDAADVIRLHYVPRKRQRVTENDFDLAVLDFMGISARGVRLAPKPAARIKKIPRDEAILDTSGGAGRLSIPPEPPEEPEPPPPAPKKGSRRKPGGGQQSLF